MKGAMADGDKLYSVYCRPVENGALVVGTDLNDLTYVDDVKEKTSAELTIFCGDTRYNTTIMNSSGVRNTGTKMDGGIWNMVQNNGTYIGKTAINGQNYYVNYTPMTVLTVSGRARTSRVTPLRWLTRSFSKPLLFLRQFSSRYAWARDSCCSR